MKLYEIKQEYLKALENIEINEDGEVVKFEEIQAISGAFDEKAEAIGCFIAEEESMVDAIAEKIKVFQERKKAHERKVESLKNYLSSEMLEANKLKIETPNIKLSFRKSTSVNILDESLIPDWYKEEVTEIKIKKKEIGETLKAGQEVPGCEYVTKQNLQIK